MFSAETYPIPENKHIEHGNEKYGFMVSMFRVAGGV